MYPLFKQCDPAWGDNPLGVSGDRTVCQSGCLVSSVAMALNDCSIMLPVNEEELAANPGTLNSWLKVNNGFEDGFGFNWTSIDTLGFVWEKFSQNATELQEAHDMDKKIFLHVRNLDHYVLMTGYSKGSLPNNLDSVFFVNDPNHDVNYYTATEVIKGEASIYTVNETITCHTNTTRTLY
ncbi:hypothetical protein FGO68_gene14701 [Halteria grandinella]|uniref:Peptidase C39-like domain-containing protein n=1 Tax=Halteria grandinella TaxID=5974 RepID=A0A8J8P2G1_HALGN|nr:hypothetical protein FGO68_gene14701 [Halteria grandinella]